MRKDAIAQLAARLTIDATKSPAAAGLVRSMTRIVAAVDSFDAGAKELKSDPNWSDVGRRKQLAQLAAAQSESFRYTEQAIETARSHINTRRAAMRPKRDPNDLVGEMRRQELRTFIRSLPAGERVQAVFADPTVADAVADALPALSGLTPEQASHIADHVMRQHPEAADLAAIDEAARAWAAAVFRGI